jgi:dihydrofolate reductase
MEGKNIAFYAQSLDGYIAGKDGNLGWLNEIPNPEHIDTGFYALMEEIDAIVMGRNTFDVVCGFGGTWPYSKPVFVLSKSLTEIPKDYQPYARLLNGSPKEILEELHSKGFFKLYIDGGRTVHDFLKAGLMDELRISYIPIILGEGIPMFQPLPKSIRLELLKSEVYLGQLVQNHYRVRKA